ncbi:hypothetical protein ACH4SP_22980 [Streptomyces sp. NPDC021093]|uniref:hypothetical protein n=1 Tax=Streptomyces sp. NPDC021093 TaxID=3365112 RepID=UPI003796CF49
MSAHREAGTGAGAGVGGEAGAEAAARAAVLRSWGFELPDSLFLFEEFLAALTPESARTLADLDVSPTGIMDVLADPSRAPRPGIDIRSHGRYYRDPPEFLTFLHGGSDGLHYGLWFGDGRTCDGVASYYTHDGGGIALHSTGTPLTAVRDIIERVWRDLHDDDPTNPTNPTNPEQSPRLRSVAQLRTELCAFETADRPELGLDYSRSYDPGFVPRTVDPARLTTLDEAGALVEGDTILDRPPHNGADEYRFAQYVYAQFEDPTVVSDWVTEARDRCAAGDPAEALALGRDLHWASAGDPALEAHAHDLLTLAYRALDRPHLAALVTAVRGHRDQPSVDVLAD